MTILIPPPTKTEISSDREVYGLESLTRRMTAARGALKVTRPVDPVAWVEEHLSLSSEASPGVDGRLKLYGYQREPLRAMCDNSLARVIIPKSARVGYSLLTALCGAYYIGHEAVPFGYTSLSKPKVQEWAKTFYNTLFRNPANTILRKIVRAVGKKGEDQDEISDRYYLNGALARLRSVAADDNLRGWRAKRVCADEVDGKQYRKVEKDTEGSKLDLIEDRITEYWDGGLVVGSTPANLVNSLIWPLWLMTDQRRYFVPCPHCTNAVQLYADDGSRDLIEFEMDPEMPQVSGFQYLEFGDGDTKHGLKFQGDGHGNVKHVAYVCRHCGSDIDEVDPVDGYSWKAWMDRHGEWRPTNGKWRRGAKPGEWIPIASDAKLDWRGYHIWAAMSLQEGVTWRKIAETFLSALTQGSRSLQRFENTWKGQPWAARLAYRQVETKDLIERTVPYPAEAPEEVIFATLGADVQRGKDDNSKRARIEASIYGWDQFETACLLGHWIIEGEPFSPDTEVQLDALRHRVFTTPSGRKVRVLVSCIDRGYSHTAVLNYVRGRIKERVYAVRGDNNDNGNEKGYGFVSRTPSRDDSKGHEWFNVDTLVGKKDLFRRLAIGRKIGGIVFPRSIAQYQGYEYFKGLMAETPRTLANGNVVFDEGTRTAEPMDCFVYARAGLELIRRMKEFKDLRKIAERLKLPREMTEFDPQGKDKSAQHIETPEISINQAGLEPVLAPSAAVAASAPAARPKPRMKVMAGKPGGVSGFQRPRMRW